ncbi:hypothetical protein Q2T83_11445 [Fervidibacter sacchari]|jgi:hypothetical protein|uniref:Uncharacterized protein n=1 Tax=Candidatus Fervidibacter sacchari TaxID=1448929 RepID=A0ABT2ESR4_9BACT|nr:hypothetical protein [Candidatus Fervidibacter sacchari]MCS3921007.1 hypothetical protein [Candidatus Fervidibacter sacchari]WKU14948.1 hypothetical protein Q2T83_11445 [Candidatus Fervidibacter sacchari]
MLTNLRQIFELPTTDGKDKIKLSELRGKIVRQALLEKRLREALNEILKK